MQLKKISALCALACAGFAGQAHAALDATSTAILNDANANGRVVYIAGASAVQKGFSGVVAKLFDSAKPMVWFGSAQDTTGSDYYAVAGTLAAGTGTWAGQKAIVIERVVGGSVYGVNSVARAESIDTLNVTAAACGSAGTGADATHAYVCTVGTGNMIPDAGVSDVAPVFFQAPINTEGETAAASLSPDELALLSSTPIYGLAFGPAVTTTVPATVKFTRANISSIMTGVVGTWDQVDASLPADDIVVCRRTPGSGTQAVFNMYFGNFPCTTNYNVPADRYASGAWDDAARQYTVTGSNGGLVVVENASSGDVKSCLNAAANATTADVSYNTKDRDGKTVKVTFKAKAGGHKAIGTLSMDSLNGSTTSSKWTFRNLDGAGQITWDGVAANLPVVSGTGKNATMSADGLSGTYIDGTWDLQAWESFNIPARTDGAKLEVLNKFLTIAQDPAVHGAVTALKYVTAGIPGGAYTGARVLQAGYLNGDQCAPYFKQ